MGTGTLFNIIFHVGTKEPPSEALLKWQQERKHKKLGKGKNERKGEDFQFNVKLSGFLFRSDQNHGRR